MPWEFTGLELCNVDSVDWHLNTRPILDIFLDISLRCTLSNISQKRALKNYRDRLNERGLSRFEVLGLDTDRGLIRSLAKQLAEKSSDAARLRATVSRTISGDSANKGGILAALRRSPLVGAELNLARPFTHGRKTKL
jgi:hypothetical protein